MPEGHYFDEEPSVASDRTAVPQLPLGLTGLLLVEALEQAHAVEVVGLVLEHPGQELVGLDRHLVAVEVVPGEVDLLGPHDRPVQAGNREAAHH